MACIAGASPGGTRRAQLITREVIVLHARRRAITAGACAAAASLALAPVAAGLVGDQRDPSSPSAFLPANPRGKVERTYLRLYREAKRQGADVGRNILTHGVKGGGKIRAANRDELRRSIRVLRGMVRQPAGSSATGDSGSGSAASPQLQAIAACESGGNPQAIGGGGTYRGKYQFTYETWSAVGGSGDPAAAPEAEQDRRAAMLLARSGTGQWPVCGG